MAKVGILKNKAFNKFEKELRAIERIKEEMRGDEYYDTAGIPTKDKLLGIDQLRKFAHGRTQKKLTLFSYGKEKTYQKRTMRAYKKRLENLIKRTAGGVTLKNLLFGMDRKKSKSGTKSPIAGTSRKQRISTIKSVKFEKMKGNIVHLKVSASGDTPGAPSHYKFQIQFPGWSRARALHPGIRGVEEVLQDPVLIHCTCKDFQFTYGFVADSAGYAIESEQSYPKIRNPKLQNTMCKHGGRVSEALIKGESGLKLYLANTMKAHAKKKQSIDQEIWAQPDKKRKVSQKEADFQKKLERKAKEIAAAAKAKDKAEKTKVYKDFTKKEKDKLFKELPKIVKKSFSAKAKTVEKVVQDYAKKAKIDPKKAVRYAKTGIQEIMERQTRAASKAMKSVRSSVKSIQENLATATRIKGDLIQARSYRDKYGGEVYEDMLKDISKEHGKSVSELKKMT